MRMKLKNQDVDKKVGVKGENRKGIDFQSGMSGTWL
jgi:hypothetical protein